MVAAACGTQKSCKPTSAAWWSGPCERAVPAPETRVPATLVMCVLKGDKMDDVVRDAVMLGATAIQPIVSERTEMGSAALARSRRVERWQRVAVSSVKQCGRAVVPPVREPADVRALPRRARRTARG